MDLHRLAEERSIAYHGAIAERLREHPEILEMARQRVEGWLASREGARFYARKWAEVLKGDAASIAAFLVERSELATELHQSSPFAGALRPRERWKIWRETAAPDSALSAARAFCGILSVSRAGSSRRA